MIRAAIVAALLLPATASAQSVEAYRGPLPMDGTPVDVRGFAVGDEPLRLVLTGTISCGLDGSEIDARGRYVNGVLTDEHAFLLLPSGARVVEEDPLSHRYVVELPPGTDSQVRLNLTPIAMRHLVTRTELDRSLSGAIMVSVLTEPAAAPLLAPTADRPAPQEASLLPLGIAAAAVALAIPLLLLLAGARRRRRRHPEQVLIARAHKARALVASEAARLGPAFDPVDDASERMLDAAVAAHRHFHGARDGMARVKTLSSEGAAQKRSELAEQQRDALDKMADLADRLEETATMLASHVASKLSPQDLEGVLEELDSELRTAVSADEEAAALL